MATKTKKRKKISTKRKVASTDTTEKEVVRTDGAEIMAMEVDEKERESMLKKLVDSSNDDLKTIAVQYRDGDDEKREKLIKHYEKFGSEYIVSVFRGNREHALLVCPPEDGELIG